MVIHWAGEVWHSGTGTRGFSGCIIYLYFMA